MQPIAFAGQCATTTEKPAVRPTAPWLKRFVAKFALDVLPAAMASVIGTLLLSHYGFSRPTPAPAPAAVSIVTQPAPASSEMVAMVRDEHTLLMNYLQSQIAAQRSRHAAEDAASARAVAEAKAAAEIKAAEIAASADAAAQRNVTVAAVKSVHPKAAATPAGTGTTASVAVSAPLVIAQAQPAPVERTDRLAQDPNSLLAKTLDIKDHVVDHVVTVTQGVISVIGDAVTSVGQRIGGALSPGPQQFSSDS